MQLLVVILKNEKLLDDILKKLAEEGVKGGTILSGKGMGEELMNMEDIPMFSTLRRLMKDEERESVHVALFVIRDEQVVEARETVKEMVNLNIIVEGGTYDPNSSEETFNNVEALRESLNKRRQY